MNKNECDCKRCKSACKQKPGWFKPEQIGPLAKNMGISVRELFDKYLAVDWYGGEVRDKDIFLLAPALKSRSTEKMYPMDPRGECVFFNKDKCDIYDRGKPFECTEYNHNDSMQQTVERHRKVAFEWEHQGELIKWLLGRTPCTMLDTDA